MRRYIVITTRFEAIHSWPECSIEEVKFLQHPHRHVFHVTAKKAAAHNDRDIEIIQLKHRMDEFIQNIILEDSLDIGRTSCEDLCERLLKRFDLDYIKVLEDGENGAEIYK